MNNRKKITTANGTLIYSQDEINRLHDLPLTSYREVVRDQVIIGYYHLLNANEMIYAHINESFVKEGNVLHINDFGIYKRSRMVPLHPITLPIFEKYKFKIPQVSYHTFKLHLRAIIELSGIKGRFYGRSEEEEISATERNKLVTPLTIYKSASANLYEQTNDMRLLLTLLKKEAPKGIFIQPYSFEEMKAGYFSEPIRGWKASTSIPPIP